MPSQVFAHVLLICNPLQLYACHGDAWNEGEACSTELFWTIATLSVTGSLFFGRRLDGDAMAQEALRFAWARASSVISSFIWTYSIVHCFTGPDGATPAAGLILDQKGNLCGSTTLGVEGRAGVVFKITP